MRTEHHHTCDIQSTLRGRIPELPYCEISQHILGASYTVSLVICGDRLARRINTEYRKKTYSPNVLSFPLSKNEGEIFLNIRKAAREAKRARISLQSRMALLFVHACFHLKGLDHSDSMERKEQEVLRAFKLATIHEPTNKKHSK